MMVNNFWHNRCCKSVCLTKTCNPMKHSIFEITLVRRWCAIAAAMTAVVSGRADPLIFDNGSVIAGNTTWNDSYAAFTDYDAFSLSSTTTIGQIDYSIFTSPSYGYQGTYISIWSGTPGSATEVVPQFFNVGSLQSNGLLSGNGYVPDGYDVSLSDLSLTLGPGTYYLGLSTDTTSGAASIASGAGSSQSIGSGLYQGIPNLNSAYQYAGDQMVFSLYSASATPSVPDGGTTIAMLGGSLIGLAALRRRLARIYPR